MGLSLTELLVEYLRSPLGLDEKAPRFSWQLSSDKKDTLQTAVEIRVREGNRRKRSGIPVSFPQVFPLALLMPEKN
ncbi:MAG: hypothetical protein ACLR6B_16520 [Blautia sp.]